MAGLFRRLSESNAMKASHVGFVAVALIVVGCQASSVPIWDVPPSVKLSEIRETPGISYYDGPGSDSVRHSLDIYSPKLVADAPTLVIIHGGEWKYGDNRCFGLYSSVGRYFASRGFVVVMANYRLSPDVKHPEHAKDVARAVAWTKANIAKYSGNPDSIFLLGHSAGGHLVSLLASDEQYLQAEGMSPRDIAGVIAVSGVYRITPGRFEVAVGGEGPLAFGVDQMVPLRGDNIPVQPLLKCGPPLTIDVFGPAFGPDPKAREAASPITHVRPGLPPFLILSAESDLPALAGMAADFHAALKNANVESRLVTVTNRNHNSIMFRAIEPGDPVGDAVIDFVRQKRP
jgi:acetyl esterase/lipase